MYGDTSVGKLHNTTFWKNLVSTDPVTENDDGNTTMAASNEKPDTDKPAISNFAMIKKMMRLKKKQDTRPAQQKVKYYTPQTEAIYADNPRYGQYYFDIKNNPEHYQLMTNDMTEEQYAVFEKREIDRADALHHTRMLMEKLIQKKFEEDRRAMQERKNSQNRKINLETLGEYKSTAFYHEKEDLFRDDDELVLMQILMDTSDRHETKKALQNHITKQLNKKSMLSPQKVLRMNDFSRDIVNGIIWDEVKERKVHPKVLFRMGLQQHYGLNLTKQIIRDQRLDTLNRELGRNSDMSYQSGFDDKPAEQLDRDADHSLHKDLFQPSQKKQQFFEVAKQMQNTQEETSANDVHAVSYRRFFLKCQKTGTLALPILSMVENQIFNCVGHYIGEGMAEAMGEVLRQRGTIQQPVKDLKKQLSMIVGKNPIEEEKVTYIPIREINLDDNGLKD